MEGSLIDNTLGSLAVLMALTWTATQVLKRMPWLNRVPQILLAFIIGEGATVTFWQAGIIGLDGADPSTIVGWFVAIFYGLFALGNAIAAHDIGSDPAKIVTRTGGQ